MNIPEPQSSPFAPEMQAQLGQRQKSRTHRGRRSRGKGPKPTQDHHADAKAHLKNAHAAPTPQAATAHLFKALSSLKKAV